MDNNQHKPNDYYARTGVGQQIRIEDLAMEAQKHPAAFTAMFEEQKQKNQNNNR